MTDFSRSQRMSLRAFLILFIKSFRSIFAASVIYLCMVLFDSDHKEGSAWIRVSYFFMAIGGLAAFLACYSYFTKTFYVKDGNLVFKHGFVRRQTSTIPLSRIHSLRTKKGIWYRITGVRGITFDTLASMGEEIELILSERDWKSLLISIEGEEYSDIKGMSAMNSQSTHMRTFSFDNRNLLWDALCQNYLKGMAIIGSALAVASQWIGDINGDTLDAIEVYAMSHWDESFLSAFNIVLFLMAVYLIVVLLWLGKVILRYYDMTMNYDDRTLTFSSGLISRSSCRFSFSKVCTLWVKRNILEHELGLCTLRLVQALYVSAKKEEDNLKLYGKDRSLFFLNWWLGSDYSSERMILSAKSGRGVFIRSLLPDLLISIVGGALLYHFGLFVWLALPIIYLSISVLKGVCVWHHSSIDLRERYIVVHSGRFARVESYVKYCNVEVIRIRRSPITRFTHRVTLLFSTSGSSFSVRSLHEREAEQIYNHLIDCMGSTKES